MTVSRETRLSPAAELVRGAIVKAAHNGGRCPTNDQLRRLCQVGIPPELKASRNALIALDELIDAGILRLEVYAKNWRVAVVLDATGKRWRTMKAPHGGPLAEPYLIREGRGGVPKDGRGAQVP